MRLAVVEVRGTDEYGQLHVRQYELDGHTNAARQRFIEEMLYNHDIRIRDVKARKVAEVERD